VTHGLAHVEQRLPEANVRPVHPIERHCVGIGNDREGRLLDALGADQRAQLDEHRLNHGAHVRRLNKAHFQVKLRELQLPVGAQRLIAEAARDLEIALDARHHKELLELLRALRQRIEVVRVQAARHDKVARPLRRALQQDRRLDLQKVALRQKLADEAHHMMAQFQIRQHARAPQVQIAILEAQRLIHIVGVAADVERRRARGVQDRDLAGHHLDGACRQIRVLEAGRSLAHNAAHLDDVLAAELARHLMGLLRGVGVDGHLRNAETVAQIHKDEPAVITAAVDPACQGHVLAGMF